MRVRSKRTIIIATIAALLITITLNSFLALAHSFPLGKDVEAASPSRYVGVTFGGNNTGDAKLLIDRVKSYTNLFVIQSGAVSKNETALTEISQYAITARMSIIVYFGYLDTQNPWQLSWLKAAKDQWGNQFLGAYLDDEPIGVMLDYNWNGFFNAQKQQNSSIYQTHAFAIDGLLTGTYPHNHDEAASLSQVSIEKNLAPLKTNSITTFTSDYVLYWFGYKGGYDVMLTQLGWNESITQNLDLIRGAARLQNKNWGSIITWKYTQAPYLDDGQEIYDQMITSYEAGAKYIIIFNYPQLPNNPYGTLQDQHFEALQRFWNTINNHSQKLPDLSQSQAVLVLPRNYAFGLRRPNDRVWGYWEPDKNAAQVWNISQILLSKYGLGLDIVYEDPVFPIADKYPVVYYWNQTIMTTQLNSQTPSANMSSGCHKLANGSSMYRTVVSPRWSFGVRSSENIRR